MIIHRFSGASAASPLPPSNTINPSARVQALALRDAHFPLLKKGINLAGWCDQDSGISALSQANAISDRDLAQIRQFGFTHVRLPVAPKLIFDPLSPTKVKEGALPALQAIVAKVLKANLAVVVDMHPDGGEVKRELATIPAYLNDYAIFWNTLASSLSQLDSDRIFFEPLNEPGFQAFFNNKRDAGNAWNRVQNTLVTAIRSGAPNNTILSSAHDYGSPGGVAQIASSDPNTVYSVHYYTPLEFTHQGSTWSGSGYPKLKGMPYPQSAAMIQNVLPSLPPEAQKLAYQYQVKPFNALSMTRDFEPLVSWARQNDKKLYLGEFGVMQQQANPVDRARWIQDLRQLCERNGMGWSMWEYDQAFGLMRLNGHNRTRTPEPLVVQALGLDQNSVNQTMAISPAKLSYLQRQPAGDVSRSSPRPESPLAPAS